MTEQKKGTSGRSYRSNEGVTITPKKSRGRTESSRRWIQRQLNDPFVAEAKSRGFRSRAALKLEQIDQKNNIINPHDVVLDLGCAPGGWLQYASIKIGLTKGRGRLVGIDLLDTDPVVGADILKGDINDDAMMAELIRLLGGKADVVLSDMAADTTGHRNTDHLRTTALLDIALDMAARVLNPGGSFLAKCFRGGTEKDALDAMRKNFAVVKHVKPAASRQESVESYVLATGYRDGTK
ncbi:MAG: RlmE family RNA methyltransferase [Candidatus Puniceispirillales bacterium WSBS_2018_MAG_OTU23]